MSENNSKSGYKHDFIHKIVAVGDGAVGKTSLIRRYTSGSFNKEYIKTLGAQFSRYQRVLGENNDIRTRLFFWDIAGQKEFSFMRPTFFNGAKGAVIVFDLTRPETLVSVVEWYEDLKKYCGELPTILFGNKLDLVDDTDALGGKVNEIVEKYNFLGYYKTSAKTGEHVTDAFNRIIEILVEKALKIKSA
ncbi:MAG: GTP-binding protein [Candidatus Lokiarchaeota archaeon]|nr:GTP-binding protein [Candidatus Lokiarchaeota archaeon]